MLAAATTARAGIVSSGADVVVIAAPSAAANTGGDGVLDNDDLEGGHVGVRVGGELGDAGREHERRGRRHAGDRPPVPGCTPGVIAAGTDYVSYFLHMDRATAGPVSINNPPNDWSITFTHTILGAFTTTGGLNGSDAQFGPAGLTYNGGTRPGFESPQGLFSITNGGYTLTIDRLAFGATAGVGISTDVDQIRVLINPEPSTWALFGLGALGLGGFVRRRRRRGSERRRTAATSL